MLPSFFFLKILLVADLLYDQEESLPTEIKFTTTKLVFAEEMQKQMLLAGTNKANAAKHYYKIVSGLYNITYYGHAWKLVQYDRSGSDGYYITDNATDFQKKFMVAIAPYNILKKPWMRLLIITLKPVAFS